MKPCWLPAIVPMTDASFMEAMLQEGEDNALLRFTMGSAFLKHQKYPQAIEQLKMAVELKPDFSSAWLLYAKALLGANEQASAREIIAFGLEAASRTADTKTAGELEALLEQF